MKKRYVAQVDLDQLKFALEVGQAAATLKMPVENPNQKTVTFVAEDMTLSFTDTPFNRAMFAIKKEFPDKFQDMMLRISALQDIVDHPRVARWVRTTEGGQEWSDSLLAAAARAPVNQKLKLQLDAVVRLASQYDKDHGTDLNPL